MHTDAELIKKISDATAKGYRVEIHAIGKVLQLLFLRIRAR
jgi:predicted amidohydrolase YtcJ